MNSVPFSGKLSPFVWIMSRVDVPGKLHAAAGPPGPPDGSDVERPEEEGHRVSLGATGGWGLHPAGQREVGVPLRETSLVPVQSEWPQNQAELYYYLRPRGGLFVWLLHNSQKYRTDLHTAWWQDAVCVTEELIKYWVGSGSRVKSKKPFFDIFQNLTGNSWVCVWIDWI